VGREGEGGANGGDSKDKGGRREWVIKV